MLNAFNRTDPDVLYIYKAIWIVHPVVRENSLMIKV